MPDDRPQVTITVTHGPNTTNIHERAPGGFHPGSESELAAAVLACAVRRATGRPA